MGHSRLECYLHLVWATYRREPLLKGDTEELIYACIRAEAKRMGCIVHALGGLEDHIHLVVEPPETFAPSQVARQVKGASSRFANSKAIAFRGQAGFAGFGLSRPHLKAAVPYVLTQRQRHESGDIWPAWEPDYDQHSPRLPLAFSPKLFRPLDGEHFGASGFNPWRPS